jgi:hypothetical protein
MAFNRSAKVFSDSLREIPVSITGTLDNFAVEVASAAGFGSIFFHGALGLIVGSPIGLAGGSEIGRMIGMNRRETYLEKDTRTSNASKQS